MDESRCVVSGNGTRVELTALPRLMCQWSIGHSVDKKKKTTKHPLQILTIQSAREPSQPNKEEEVWEEEEEEDDARADQCEPGGSREEGASRSLRRSSRRRRRWSSGNLWYPLSDSVFT